MFEIYLLIIGLVSTGLCAFWDLKTTEIPDIIPLVTILLSLAIYSYVSFQTKNFEILKSSLLWGFIFSMIGFILYFFGQWGGGDAEILASMGFLTGGFKNNFLPFPIVYFFNLFFVGSIYMLLYAVLITKKNKKVLLNFKKSIKKTNSELILIFVVILAIFSLYATRQTDSLTKIEFLISSEAAFFFLYFIWVFAKVVEDFGFKKRIPVKDLKVGDVLLSNKRWVGITKEELKRIKKSGKKYVWIKEGVRFAPSFFLALLVSYFFGLPLLYGITFTT